MRKSILKAVILSFCCVVVMSEAAYGFSRRLGPVIYTHRYYLLQGDLRFDYEKIIREKAGVKNETEIFGQTYDFFLEGDVYDPRLISYIGRFTLDKTNITNNRNFESDLTAKSYNLYASLFPTKRLPVTLMARRNVYEFQIDGYDRETTRDRYDLYWFWEFRRFPLTTWSYQLNKMGGETTSYRYGVKMTKDFNDTNVSFNSSVSKSPKEDKRANANGISISHRKRISDHVALSLQGNHRTVNGQTGEGASELLAKKRSRSTNMSAALHVRPSKTLQHSYRYNFRESSNFEQEIGQDTKERDTERHRFTARTSYRISEKLHYSGSESISFDKRQVDSNEITTKQVHVSSELKYRIKKNTSLSLGVNYSKKIIDDQEGERVEEEYGFDGGAAFRHVFKYEKALSWAGFSSSYSLGAGYRVKKKGIGSERGAVVDEGIVHSHSVDLQLKQINLYGSTRYASSLMRYRFSIVDDVGSDDDRTEHLLRASVKSRYFKRTTIKWHMQYKSIDSLHTDGSKKTVMFFDINHTRRLYRGRLKLTLDHERKWDHVSDEKEVETEYKAVYLKPLTYRTVLELELSRKNKKTNDKPARTKDFMSAEVIHRLRAWKLKFKYSYAVTEDYTDSRIFMSATRKFIRGWR